MNLRYSSLDVNKNSSKNILFNLSKLKLLEPFITKQNNNNIDILKYLDDLEKNNTINTKKKFNLKSLPHLKTPINSNTNKSYQMKLNNSADINKHFNKNNNNINNNNDGCFLTSLKIEKISTNNNINTYKFKRNINNNKYNLASIIKDIKKKNQSYVSKTEGNYFNENIAYDNKNLRAILDINSIINKYIKNDEWDFREKENKYNDFVERKKGVCIHNVMIKLMRKERAKLKNKFINFVYGFNNQKKAVEEGEKIFEQIITDQKRNTKLVENNYYKLINDNKVLIYLRENLKEQVKKTEYEIMKKIYEIDELRFYAKFVNYIYGYDNSLYEKSIIDKDSSKNSLDIELLVKEVIEKYKYCLNKEHNEIINSIDPDIILNEIILIQDRILLNLKLKDQEYEELKRYKNHNRNILENIENKKLQLEDEYNYIKKELNDLEINTRVNIDQDLFNISKDLYLFILEQYCPDKKIIKKYKADLNLFELADLSEKSVELVLKNESKLDSYMILLDKYNKEDKKLFDNLLNKRKEEFIRDKINEKKNSIERKIVKEKMEIQENSNKVYFINRKSLPNIPRKKKIVIKLDPEIIKAKENKEMISYE